MIQRSLIGNVKHVWSDDPGLNKEHPEFDETWKKFRESVAGDVSVLAPVTKEGAKLTVFELRPLSRQRFNAIMGRAFRGMEDLTLEDLGLAVAFSLRSVQDYEIDGSPVRVEHHRVNGEDCVKKEVLDKIYDHTLFVELGLRVLTLSRIHF